MRAQLVTVGDELLSGRTVNSNAAHLGQRLARLGAPVEMSVTVGDKIEEIACAVRQAVSEYDVVVVTGGLGPTHDDVTVEAVAQALDAPLELDGELLERIEERYRRWHRTPPAGVKKMALIPTGAQILPNEWGTAPGLHLHHQGTHVFVLPGVPAEMRGILGASVEPVIAGLPGRKDVHVRALATAGVPESKLAERLADLLPPPDGPIMLAFLPGYSGVEVRLTGHGEPVDLDRQVERIRERLGEAVVGDAETTSLLAFTCDLLFERRETLATGESCTGGLLGKLLTDRPGSSDFFQGGVVAYSNALKEHLLAVPAETLEKEGAVSEAAAMAMAAGARQRFGTTYALSVTGIAGPGGGSPEKPVGLVYLGLAHPGGTRTHKLNLANDRAQNRERAAYAAIDLLRRHLLRLVSE